MMRDYVEKAYLPLSGAVRARLKDHSASAKALNAWCRTIYRRWPAVHIGTPAIRQSDEMWQVQVPVYLGEIPSSSVRAELFADVTAEHESEVIILHEDHPIPGSTNGYIYAGAVTTDRPMTDYTVRVVPDHPDAVLPTELPLIAWQR